MQPLFLFQLYRYNHISYIPVNANNFVQVFSYNIMDILFNLLYPSLSNMKLLFYAFNCQVSYIIKNIYCIPIGYNHANFHKIIYFVEMFREYIDVYILREGKNQLTVLFWMNPLRAVSGQLKMLRCDWLKNLDLRVVWLYNLVYDWDIWRLVFNLIF